MLERTRTYACLCGKEEQANFSDAVVAGVAVCRANAVRDAPADKQASEAVNGQATSDRKRPAFGRQLHWSTCFRACYLLTDTVLWERVTFRQILDWRSSKCQSKIAKPTYAYRAYRVTILSPFIFRMCRELMPGVPIDRQAGRATSLGGNAIVFNKANAARPNGSFQPRLRRSRECYSDTEN